METKVNQINETTKFILAKKENNSLTINGLTPHETAKNEAAKTRTHLPIPFGSERLNLPVIIFKGIKTKTGETTTLGTFLATMKQSNPLSISTSESLKNAYQTFKETDDKEPYNKIKNNLNGVVFGDYSTRLDENCLSYYGLLGMDIDGYNDPLEMSWDMETLKKDAYVFAVFPSPSVHGLRILFLTDSTFETHKATYKTLLAYLSDFLNITTDKDKSPHLDPSTSNPCRLWFFTHTTDVYLNLDSKVFTPSVYAATETQTTVKPAKATDKKPHTNNRTLTETEKIEACIEMSSRRNNSTGRNNFVYSTACLCVEHGVSTDAILSHFITTYVADDFTKAEIQKTVNSAVKRAVFGKYTDGQLLKYLKNDSSKEVQTFQAEATATPSVSQAKKAIFDPKDTITGTFDADKNEAMNEIEKYIEDKYNLRYNIISNDVEISFKDKNRFVILTSNDLLRELQREKYRTSDKSLKVSLGSSFVPKYNPIKNYFENLPTWQTTDKDHITHLSSYVKASDQFWFNSQFKKAIVRTAACALGLIPFNKQCFTLVGKQNDGKTSFVRFLCPPLLKPYIKESLDINKDGLFALCQNFIINLDELATFSKQDINQIKTYFTTETVKERPPYGDKPLMFKRVVSFFASTNNREFLTDETGNVRWLVFEIDSIQHDNGGSNGYGQNVDINGVWSQAFALLNSGFDYKLTADELAYSENNNNTKHRKTTYEMELIQDLFDPATEQEHDVFLTAAKIKDEIELGSNRKTNHVQIGKALTMLGFECTRKYHKEQRNTVNGYYLKRRQIM